MARTKGNFGHDKKDKQAVIALAGRIKNFDLRLAADESLWDDREVVLAAVASRGWNIRWISEALKADREIVSVAVTSYGQALVWCHDGFQSDPEIVMAAIKSHGTAIQHASPELKNDPKIVRMAIEQSGLSLEYVSDHFKNDRETVMAALRSGDKNGASTAGRNPWILRSASDQLRGDREVVKTAIQNCGGSSIMFASDELRGDRDLVLIAVQDCGLALEDVDPVLQADRDVVMKAVEQHCAALKFASAELKGDREVAMAALKASLRSQIVPCVLEYVSEELRGDKAFVLQAVGARGLNLQFASTGLKGDREIVETALKDKLHTRASAILKSASKVLRGDRQIVSIAISDDSASLHLASEELQLDPAMVALAFDTIREDHDLDLFHFFQESREESNLRAVYLQQVLALQKELSSRNESDKFDLKDPNSTVQVAEKWLSESLEKRWLIGQIVSNMGVPWGLRRGIVKFTGVREDIQVAAKLLRFSSVLCYMKKGIEENWPGEFWENFINEALAVGRNCDCP